MKIILTIAILFLMMSVFFGLKTIVDGQQKTVGADAHTLSSEIENEIREKVPDMHIEQREGATVHQEATSFSTTSITMNSTTNHEGGMMTMTGSRTHIREESVVQDDVSPSVTTQEDIVLDSFVQLLPQTNEKLRTGIHAGRVSDLIEYERRIGGTVDFVATAIHWGNENEFPERIAHAVAERGATLFVFWYPMDYEKNAQGQSAFSFKNILTGKWDSYIESFKQSARTYEGKIIIAPFEEVNGNWTYWNGIEGAYGTIDEYKATYQYLREKFRDVPNVSFAWVINHVSVPNTPANSISAYYPGDTVVDIIGINAFNFGSPWLSFDTLIADTIDSVAQYEKPILVTSTGSAEEERKALWIHQFFQSRSFQEGILSGFVWFNVNKEHDWRIWSSRDSERAFIEELQKLQK